MRILALDLGGKCGFAIYDNGTVVSGTWKLVKTSTKKRLERSGYRFVRFWNNLEQIELKGKIDYVYYEEVHAHAGTDAAHAYGAFRGVLMLFCDNRAEPIPYDSFGVGTIKKRATGKGNSKKPEMIKAANKKLLRGRKVIDDNEADSLFILLLGLEKLGITLPNPFSR